MYPHRSAPLTGPELRVGSPDSGETPKASPIARRINLDMTSDVSAISPSGEILVSASLRCSRPHSVNTGRSPEFIPAHPERTLHHISFAACSRDRAVGPVSLCLAHGGLAVLGTQPGLLCVTRLASGGGAGRSTALGTPLAEPSDKYAASAAGRQHHDPIFFFLEMLKTDNLQFVLSQLLLNLLNLLQAYYETGRHLTALPLTLVSGHWSRSGHLRDTHRPTRLTYRPAADD